MQVESIESYSTRPTIEQQSYNICSISRALIGWSLSSIRGQMDKITVHAQLYANELLVRVRFAFQKLYLFQVFDQFRVLL